MNAVSGKEMPCQNRNRSATAPIQFQYPVVISEKSRVIYMMDVILVFLNGRRRVFERNENESGISNKCL